KRPPSGHTGQLIMCYERTSSHAVRVLPYLERNFRLYAVKTARVTQITSSSRTTHPPVGGGGGGGGLRGWRLGMDSGGGRRAVTRGLPGQRWAAMGGTDSRGVYLSWVSRVPVTQALKALR